MADWKKVTARSLGRIAGKYSALATVAGVVAIGGVAVLASLSDSVAAWAIGAAEVGILAAIAVSAAHITWSERRRIAQSALRISITAAAALAVAAGIGVVVVGASVAYRAADGAGVVQHNRQEVITASADWMPGETRTCTSFGHNAFAFLNCGGGRPRLMAVRFFGREQQPEYSLVFWKCTRNDDSFTCREAAGEKAATAQSN